MKMESGRRWQTPRNLLRVMTDTILLIGKNCRPELHTERARHSKTGVFDEAFTPLCECWKIALELIRGGSRERGKPPTLSFGFADFKTRLAESGGFDRIHPRFEVGFLQEVSPADMAVFRGLALFELLKHGLGAFLTFNHGHNAAGLISS